MLCCGCVPRQAAWLLVVAAAVFEAASVLGAACSKGKAVASASAAAAVPAAAPVAGAALPSASEHLWCESPAGANQLCARLGPRAAVLLVARDPMPAHWQQVKG